MVQRSAADTEKIASDGRDAMNARDARIRWLGGQSDQRIAHILRDAFNAFQRLLQYDLVEHDIALGQWAILRALWSEEGLSQHELSARAGVMDPTGLVTIRTLEKSGLVSRMRRSEDRKRIFVYLTPQGRALKDVLLPIAEGISEIARDGVSDSDLEVTRRTLLIMAQNLTDRLEKRNPSKNP